MSIEWGPDWRPPEDGVTAANLYQLPGLGLPPHTELIDGSLFFPGPARVFHESAIELLRTGLEATVPGDLLVRTHMALTLDLRTRVEPDILVMAADAQPAKDQPEYPAHELVLAVEVVSPVSEIRDRELKPKLYLDAGIKHFWRVEEENGEPVVYVHELSPVTSEYFMTGTHRDRLKLSVPYDIDINLVRIGET